MNWLSIDEVYTIHEEIIKKAGSKASVRDFSLLHSAVERPKATYDGTDLYPTIFAKAAALLHSLCMNHPFTDGNGRVGRLLTLLLLYQCGYGVGRYISLERIVEQSKETYYEALHRSSQGWHEGRHDLRPWWNYFLGTLIAAYKEFEERVGTITTARGAKREMVQQTIKRLPSRFRFG